MINRRIPVAVALLFCFLCTASQAQLTFDASTENATGVIDNVGSSTTWNTDPLNKNWVNSVPNNVAFTNTSVFFGSTSGFGTGPVTVNVAASVSVTNMTIAKVAGLSHTFTGQRITGTSTLLVDSFNNSLTTTFDNATGGANQFANFTLRQGSVAGSAGISVSTNISLEDGNISTVLSGAAAATKSTAGTVTLSGANAYTGLTTVSAGTLQLSGSGTTGTGALTVNGSGTMNLGGQTRTVGAVTLGGTGAITNGTLTGTSYTSTGGSVSAVLQGTGVTFTNTSGTTTLSGANTYSGLTTVSGGTVQLSGSGTTGTGALTVNGTGTLDLGGTSRTVGVVNLGGTGSISNGTLTGTSYTSTGGSVSAVLAGAGVFTNTSGTTTLSATNTYSGGTNVLSGTLNANATGALGSGNVSVSSGSTLNLGANDVISNSASLTVDGTLNVSNFTDTVGSLTLNVGGNITGTGTLTGSTFNLQSGNVTANLVGGNVAIANGATLDSNLTVGSGKTLSGAGTIDGNLVFSAGSFLAVDSTISTTLDLSKIIKVTGLTSTLSFTDFTLASLTGVNWALKDAGTYTLISGGAGGVSLLGNSSTFTNQYDLGGGKFGYFQAGSLDLIITAVPEPSSILLVVLGTAGLAIRRRNRR